MAHVAFFVLTFFLSWAIWIPLDHRGVFARRLPGTGPLPTAPTTGGVGTAWLLSWLRIAAGRSP
jgi:hypothetical protein